MSKPLGVENNSNMAEIQCKDTTFQILLANVKKNSLLCIEIGEKPESKWLDPVCDKTHTTILLLPLVR